MMAQENRISRDLFFKICFMYFANYILKILEIDEEIIEIKPTESITLKNIEKPKIFNEFLDFVAITKSGKILIFEFKKNSLRMSDLKQVFSYYKSFYCKNEGPVKTIIITISDKGKITEYDNDDLTYHPQIIKTKTIDKQQDLSIIRDKLKREVKLTSYECALLITFPLFKLEESEVEITEEMCKNIKKKKNCIPEEELDKITIAMYLNIIEYIDEDKQNRLMEMIGLAEKIEGIIAQIRNEARNDEKKNIINRLRENISIDEIARLLGTNKMEILNILQK